MLEFNQVNRPTPLPELTAPEIEQYLASGLFRGIGKKTAALLVSHFGADTLNVLEHSPEQLFQVPRLQRYRIAAITEAIRDSSSNPMRSAIAWLLGLSIPLGLTLKLCERYGHQTESVLKSNPYRIIDEVDGIGFKTADALALAIGISPHSEQRYSQGIVQVLKDALSEGHCFVPFPQLLMRALELLSSSHHTPDPLDVQAVIQSCLTNQTLVEANSNGSIYLKRVYRAELNVALFVKAQLEGQQQPTFYLSHWLHHREQVSHTELSRLSKEQREALSLAWTHPFSILTGGPGRGKTHILKYLVQWLCSQGVKLALAAPTGKAAARMKEATGYEAQTIHRLLQWEGHGQSFRYNPNNPLPIDWLIVDEFSMVDLFLFHSLLKALQPTTRLLLVGDSNQLPSVGAGMVLRDLILSELIPTTQLQTIYRQEHESPIIYAAEEVLSGKVPMLHQFNQPSSWMDVGDCSMLCRSTPSDVADAIVDLALQMKADDIDLNQQLMVLAPQKQGAAGVKALNARLQPIFNPKRDGEPEVVTGEVVYRIGDRVIQLVNRYDTTPAVMNGESGWVVLVNANQKQVTVEFEGGAIVDYFPGNFEQIMHAYCLTCHKSQGSEFQYVIMPLVLSNRRMLTRQLLYTTMTRASRTFIAVGQPEALEVAVATDKPARRYTQLSQFLLAPEEDLTGAMRSLAALGGVNQGKPGSFVTIASRLRERKLGATKGQMTSIGSLALRFYEDKFGHRPSKQLEVMEGMRFKTYHYGVEAVDLIDRAIDAVLKS
ncbi:MAG TPA: ATP-dependent RecD-like DNA helicase [Allocoleopsis sp.]